MKTFVQLIMQCQDCGVDNHRDVLRDPPGNYDGTILKTIWCDNCGSPVAVRYKVEEGEASIKELLVSSEVLVPRKPDTGITIRPRASKKRYH